MGAGSGGAAAGSTLTGSLVEPAASGPGAGYAYQPHSLDPPATTRPLVADGYVTTRLAVVWWIVVPLVPVTVNVNVPRGVLPLVLTVIVDVPGATTEPGEKVAVTPDGRPDTERATVPPNPPCEERFTVYDVDLPRLTLLEDGATESPKSWGTATTSVTDDVCTRAPLVPVIVSG